MLKLKTLIEKNVAIIDEIETFVGELIELENDIGVVDWILISKNPTLVGFSSKLDFHFGRKLIS